MKRIARVGEWGFNVFGEWGLVYEKAPAQTRKRHHSIYALLSSVNSEH